jgi:choline dehydrogenase
MDSFLAGVDLVRDIVTAGPLRGLAGAELTPGPDARTRGEIEARTRQQLAHTFHPSCTARIGTAEDGVVDHELRVHGVEGLRVADASVFPTVPHGNTHAPTVLVGEKAVDLIRATS